jgi:hypothetical protein
MDGEAASMQRVTQIEARRIEIVKEMLAMRSMCRGALSEQYLKGRRADGAEVEHGPYYVLSHWVQGKNQSRRVRAGDVEEVKRDLAHYEQFSRWCEEFARLTEELGRLEREQAVVEAASKKKPKLRSKRLRK